MLQRLWHGSSGGATFASGLKGAAGAAKVDKYQQLTSAFMQELDSKDKIAARLQPATRKIFRRRFAASAPLPRSKFAPSRAKPVLALKRLAIMNFS
jgi:hypothetical protein